MAYCGPRGIPWTEFLSWDKWSRDAAILWARQQAETCTCGTRLEEWDPKAGGHPAAYVATVRSCPGCAALERRDERLRAEIEKGEKPRGSRAVLRVQRPFRP
ncbi:hypothetical protein Psed_5797 [Pseudonocardia dioxanivorans CB1190]|uniref:Zinc-finger domain-containing protein n=1 Tax=Pseudonocardia dioxanivorans (strain ATCC 55486 / DSM 44775 / JCM 13855 / CB1190) TaxID=675635 RepID=F4D1D6_PSEUX|nr:hypothetical protein [Pseudonocardia dioxanivorans]AEA27924.1 hypothetical protein Psed_5797 [Pseudonocardia dioxanivorans CB1190]